jgi:serine/threonine protein kinase
VRRSPYANSYQLVRKELKDSAEPDVELENLAMLNHLRHPYIVELLTSYSYKNGLNLVFPLADGGTLADLFKRDLTGITVDDLLVSLAGISSALEHVHNFTERSLDLSLIGCHHDLRPKNILLSQKRLVLADFGLSRFKESSENSMTLFKQGKGDYLAPECEDLEAKFQHSPVGRSSDVWSFVCILAEVATYVEFGPKGILDFRKERRFEIQETGWILHYFHCGPRKANPGVTKWLQNLAARSSLVTKMLAVFVQKTLALKVSDRPNAREVTKYLRLVALSSVAKSIIELLESLLERDYSLDLVLERMKFKAWVITAQVGGSNLGSLSKDCSWSVSLHHFEANLGILNKIRELLNSAWRSKQDSGQGWYRSLRNLSDDLGDLLHESEQYTLRNGFRDLVLEEIKDESAETYQHISNSKGIEHTIKTRLALKHMTRLVLDHADIEREGRNINPASIKTEKRFGQHHLGTIHGTENSRPILIEWRNYGHSAGETVNQQIFKRMKSITGLLSQRVPRQFQALECCGFYHDASRRAFGIVFEIPHQADTLQCEPVSLNSWINSTKQLVYQPPLERKFKLALTIANAVHEFHSVGWMHKNLNSLNIAFFPPKERPNLQLASEPYIIGFHHSRRDDPYTFTERVIEANIEDYHFPEYLQNRRRYRREFDYYSLGLVLLEIGLWKTLKLITETWDNMDSEETSKKLLESRVPLLSQSMGTLYLEAVRFCVEAPGQGFAQERTLSQFYSCVIEKLKSGGGER